MWLSNGSSKCLLRVSAQENRSARASLGGRGPNGWLSSGPDLLKAASTVNLEVRDGGTSSTCGCHSLTAVHPVGYLCLCLCRGDSPQVDSCLYRAQIPCVYTRVIGHGGAGCKNGSVTVKNCGINSVWEPLNRCHSVHVFWRARKLDGSSSDLKALIRFLRTSTGYRKMNGKWLKS